MRDCCEFVRSFIRAWFVWVGLGLVPMRDWFDVEGGMGVERGEGVGVLGGK